MLLTALAMLLGIVVIAMLHHDAPNGWPLKFAWLSLGSVIAILGIVIAGLARHLYFRFFGADSAHGQVDAEAERAWDLQADLSAGDNIQLPLRAMTQAQKQKKSQGQPGRGQPDAFGVARTRGAEPAEST